MSEMCLKIIGNEMICNHIWQLSGVFLAIIIVLFMGFEIKLQIKK